VILTSIFIAVLFLAYSNGANDNFKGVATLWGSGTLEFKNALILANLTTFLGAITSIFIAKTLILNFSGKGLVPDEVVIAPSFILAVALGAAFTILLATIKGFPISTTHSLVGALVGAGFCSAPTQLDVSKLGKTFFLPLVLSPILALLLSTFVYTFFKKLQKTLKINHENWLNKAHVFTGGMICFSHGLNDTPKIAGLLVMVSFFGSSIEIFILSVFMIIGSVLQTSKVAERMSHNITKFSHSQGFAANLVTSFLVILASKYSMPVSFTHISVGSLVGIGLVNGKADYSQIKKILISWAITLPCSAFFAGVICFLIKLL
jgi:inorganic phosphate transporter, PiT family